jgi:hypothetical protein
MIGYFIIFIILTLIIFAFIRYGISCNKSVIKNITKEDFLNLKSGDLVFVSYKNFLGNSVRILSSSEWSHVGMIYKEVSNDEESLYVLEVADYQSSEKFQESTYSGVIKVPYHIWLNLNKNHKIGFRRLNEDLYEKIKENVFSEFMKLKIYKQQKLTDISSWKRLMFFDIYDENELLLQEKITCIEFLVIMLQNLNIMEKNYKPSSYYPCDLISNTFLTDYEEIKIL